MKDYQQFLDRLTQVGNLRRLPDITQHGVYVHSQEGTMVNCSSNDYLGLAHDTTLRRDFLTWAMNQPLPLSSSSSRLLTGNSPYTEELEQLLQQSFGREAALVFNSGYHANTGILSALADKHTLIIADKLAHASIIDGLKLSNAAFRRYRHQDYIHLDNLLEKEASQYDQVIIATESIFSMDGDVTDLRQLIDLKKRYSNVLLYVDEAHAIGVRGPHGLGIAEEMNCIADIDLLVGTFGKALASMGAYVLCSKTLRDYLVNTARSLIFSTALPPFQTAWTSFVFRRLPEMQDRRNTLAAHSNILSQTLTGHGGELSTSHIIPWIVGTNEDCISVARQLRRRGFYCLPVRPPTVPQGTSRIRFSLTADIPQESLVSLAQLIQEEIHS